MIYRKHIPQWTEKFGEYHSVWFYTKHIMHESVANYRKMEEAKMPVSVQEEFEKSPDVSSVIQNRKTGEVIKSYNRS